MMRSFPFSWCVVLGLLTFLRPAPAATELHPRMQALPAVPGLPGGPFVRTAAGSLLGLDGTGALVSSDEGFSWSPRPILDPRRFLSRPERALLRTPDGVILYAFLNEKERDFRWDEAKGGPQPGCRLPLYVCRSEDDGLTWSEPRLLQDGWCGAVRQFLRTKGGRIILVSQRAEAAPGRHVTLTYASDDRGLTWQAGPPIDLGAAGNYTAPGRGLSAATHGGGVEGTVYERANGELRLLLRVPHGHFLEFSSKDGLRWTSGQPSVIESSDSPGMVIRLASGRLMLAWNRWRDPVRREGRREELSVAFSGNDGITWSIPCVIAAERLPVGVKESSRTWIAYPYLFEASPGRVWVSTMQGGLKAALAEADFIAPSGPGIDGRPGRIPTIITLGDSITRAVRREVAPEQAFAAVLQAAFRSEGLAVQVHNVGIGGERTDQALERLDRDVISQRPDIVTVMYGANDGWIDEGKTEPRLPAEQYEANLRQIIGRLRKAGAAVVLMTSPRFAEENRRNGLGEDPNLRLEPLVERARRVARELGVPLVDHFAGWSAVQQSGRRLQPWTTDGCHPTPEGHAELAARILPVLREVVRTVRP